MRSPHRSSRNRSRRPNDPVEGSPKAAAHARSAGERDPLFHRPCELTSQSNPSIHAAGASHHRHLPGVPSCLVEHLRKPFPTSYHSQLQGRTVSATAIAAGPGLMAQSRSLCESPFWPPRIRSSKIQGRVFAIAGKQLHRLRQCRKRIRQGPQRPREGPQKGRQPKFPFRQPS